MKYKISSILILCVNLAYGQWSYSNINFQNFYYFEDVSFANSNLIIGVDPFRNVFFSNDAGRSFNLSASYSIGLNSTFFANDSLLYVAAFGLHKSLDYGKTLEYVPMINKDGDTIPKILLDEVVVFKNDEKFCARARYDTRITSNHVKIYKYNLEANYWYFVDTNKTMTAEISPSDTYMAQNIFVFDSTAIGNLKGAKAALVKYLNYGDSISVVDVSKLIGNQSFKNYGYAFQSIDTGIVITKDTFYVTYNGGITFEKINKPNNQKIFGNISYAKPTQNRAGFYMVTSSSGTFYTRDFGKTWVDMQDFISFYRLFFYDAEHGIGNANDGAVYTFDNLTSVTDIENNNTFSIYPNPAQNKLNITGVGNFKVQIFNLNGVELTPNFNNPKSIDTALLPNGFYLLKIETTEGVHYKKFLKTE